MPELYSNEIGSGVLRRTSWAYTFVMRPGRRSGQQKRRHCQPPLWAVELGLVLRALFLVAVTGLDRSSDPLQHGLGLFRMRTGRGQLKVLLKSLGRARRRNHFVSLECGRANQIRALPIISIGPSGIGGNRLIEGLG